MKCNYPHCECKTPAPDDYLQPAGPGLGCPRMIRMEAIKDKAWIGVDFDGTMAYHFGWTPWNELGRPIKAMVDRVQQWIAEGKDVRIFTARVGSDEDEEICLVTGQKFTRNDMFKILYAWCQEHIGVVIPVTAKKDKFMVELWDDRAVQVVPNTGITLADELAAIKSAEAGKGPAGP